MRKRRKETLDKFAKLSPEERTLVLIAALRLLDELLIRNAVTIPKQTPQIKTVNQIIN